MAYMIGAIIMKDKKKRIAVEAKIIGNYLISAAEHYEEGLIGKETYTAMLETALVGLKEVLKNET